MNAKLSGLLALLKVRKASPALITQVNKFASSYRDALDARNRIVHDVWLNDDVQPYEMGVLKITADKVLTFGVATYQLPKLIADVATIDKRRLEAGAIRKAIVDALPTLPALPQRELYPIIETPFDQ